MTTAADHRFTEVKTTLTSVLGVTDNYPRLVQALKEAAQKLGDFVTTRQFGQPRPKADPNDLLLWAEGPWQESFWLAADAAIASASRPDGDLRLTVWTLDDKKPGHQQAFIATTGIFSSFAEEDPELPERIVFADGQTVDTGSIVGVQF